ncbi:MAG TPA: hypothetical protein VGL15_04180 [Vicinamibacteria bacterium]|jgi:hypothetical protein
MILEEFVALSAVEVVFGEKVRSTIVEQAPPQLLKRVRFIDRDRSDRKHAAFFAPLAEEFGITVDRATGVVDRPKSMSHDFVQELNILYLLLVEFFVGIEHRLQVDMPPQRVRMAAATVRAASRSAENRARLATLEGVLGLYGDESVPSLTPHDRQTATLVGAFAALVEEDLYRSMSHEAYRLGIPSRVSSALDAMRSKARQLLATPRIRQLFDLGSRGIAVATRLPVPDSQQTADLLGSDPYLPPCVKTMGLIDRAHRSWVEMQSGSRE